MKLPAYLVRLGFICVTSVALGQGSPAKGTPGRSHPPASAVLEKAAKIIVPQIEFRDATVREAIDYLSKKSIELDPAAAGSKGVNLILKSAANQDTRITLSLTGIPLLEALKYVASLANLKVVPLPSGLLLTPVTENTSGPFLAEPPPGTLEAAYLDRAMKQIVPHLALQGATVAEAVGFLQKKSSEVSPEGKPVNIIVKFSPGHADARITLNLNNVPIPVILGYVAQLTDLKLEVNSAAFYLHPPEENLTANLLPASPVLEKASKIIIPQIEFRDATVREGTDFLKKKSVDLDSAPPGLKGINMILDLPENNDAKLTFSLTDIPVLEALKYVAQLADLKIVPGPYALFLAPAAKNTSGLLMAPPPRGTPDAAYMDSAMKIIVPKLEFRQANLNEALDFLRKKSVELNPGGKPLNIVVKTDPANAEAKLTLSLANVPIPVILGYIAEMSGLRFQVVSGVFYLHPPGENPTAIPLAKP